MRHHYRQFYKAAKFLKENLTFEWPVVIRRIVLSDVNDGDCTLTENRFLIRIEKRLPEYYATEILIHEIAHALAWEKDRDVHGKHWGIAYSRVYRLYLRYLMENSVTMNSKTNYHLNEHYLDYIDSEDKAYWLGFLNADRFVHLDDTGFIIKLSSIDVDHLCKFSRCVGSDHKLVYNNEGVYGTVSVAIENKHLTERLTYREIPNELRRHFWRGFIDGNGVFDLHHHRNKTPRPIPQLRLRVVGNKEIIGQFRNFCLEYQPAIRANLTSVKDDYSFRLYGPNALCICKCLYDNVDFYLDRKLQKFIEITKIVEDRIDETLILC